MHRDAARGLAEDGHVRRIASERGDVPLHPLEGGDLVHVGVVALELFRMLAAQRGEREEAEALQAVVEGDEDDALPGERDPRRAGEGAAAEHEGAAVDPHHDRQLRPRFGPGRPPHVDEQAVLRGGLRDRPGAGREARLRAVRAELARIALSLPRGHGLGRTPAIGADRRGGKGDPLEAGDVPFGHAADDPGGGTNRRRRGLGTALRGFLCGSPRGNEGEPEQPRRDERLPGFSPLHDSSFDSRACHAPTCAAHGFSGFFPKTSFATVTAVTALGQPA